LQATKLHFFVLGSISTIDHFINDGHSNFLGMFLDGIGIVLLTMPIFVPIIIGLGYAPIWFGVVFCLNMQVSFLGPPFGQDRLGFAHADDFHPL